MSFRPSLDSSVLTVSHTVIERLLNVTRTVTSRGATSQLPSLQNTNMDYVRTYEV
jgi:hypothetical protein